MPLEQWADLYGAIQANRLEALAADTAVAHASNPKRLRDQLMRDAVRAAAPSRNREDLLRDPEKMRRLMERHGVAVKTSADDR